MTIKKDKILEFSFGFLTLFLVFLLCFIFFKNSYFSKVNSLKHKNYKTYYASFDDIEGVFEGSDIKIAGINVGKLEQIIIDENFQAVAKLKVLKDIKIPNDSMIIVATSGFLGSKFLKIIPSNVYEVKEYLNENEHFTYTQSSIGLENLLSLFNKK